MAGSPTVEIPAAFRARAASQAHWADWFAGLPALLRKPAGRVGAAARRCDPVGLLRGRRAGPDGGRARRPP